MMRPVWIDPPELPAGLPRLHSSPLLHGLLARRGIRNAAAAAAFLDARPRPAPDPSGFPNLHEAIGRIARALECGERIGIFGDYDADGVTATALLVRALRSASRQSELVRARLPHRAEGYGLNRAAIDELVVWGATLLVAVDCGSSDPPHVAYARSCGLDVVVLDHHQISCEPSPGAIVASAQLPGGERFVDLCSAGLAYLVAAGLAREGLAIGGTNGDHETDLLDLVALGTIGDIVPVAGINRPLVRDGIAQLRKGKRTGLHALSKRAGFSLQSIDAEAVSFKLTPRLNAAGRMGDPQLALDLLTEDDPISAAVLASRIEQLNEQRRTESANVLREAELTIDANPELLKHPILVVSGRDWPGGLLGPVSSQLVERYRRPAIALSDNGAQSHGSARSVPGFDITAALRSADDLLVRFGGHAQAAGLAIASGKLPELRERLESALGECGLRVPAPPSIAIDAEIMPAELTLETALLLSQLQPFGMGNEAPVLRVRDVGVRQWEAVGQDKRHLRLQLAGGGGAVKAIAFGMAARSRELVTGRRVDIAATLKIDEWNGQRRLDLQVLDFRPAE